MGEHGAGGARLRTEWGPPGSGFSPSLAACLSPVCNEGKGHTKAPDSRMRALFCYRGFPFRILSSSPFDTALQTGIDLGLCQSCDDRSGRRNIIYPRKEGGRRKDRQQKADHGRAAFCDIVAMATSGRGGEFVWGVTVYNV